MSEFKFRVVTGIFLIISVVLFCIIIFRNSCRNVKVEAETCYPHALSIYTAEGDTILDIDTNSDWVKVWIGDSCGVDVWTINEEGGWTRK